MTPTLSAAAFFLARQVSISLPRSLTSYGIDITWLNTVLVEPLLRVQAHIDAIADGDVSSDDWITRLYVQHKNELEYPGLRDYHPPERRQIPEGTPLTPEGLGCYVGLYQCFNKTLRMGVEAVKKEGGYKQWVTRSLFNVVFKGKEKNFTEAVEALPEVDSALQCVDKKNVCILREFDTVL